MKKILIPVLLLGSLSLSGQIRNDEVFELPEMEISDLRNDIRIPDVDGFHVLKCDFHTHTIFSDGRVWPTMRVDEAWKDGLDAIAITDHIEVRPVETVRIGRRSELVVRHRQAAGRPDRIHRDQRH